MNLTTNSLHNPMRKEDIGLPLLKIRGDQLTWKILTDETQQSIMRSSVRSATKTSPNLRVDPPQGEDQPQDLTSDMLVYGRHCPDGCG